MPVGHEGCVQNQPEALANAHFWAGKDPPQRILRSYFPVPEHRNLKYLPISFLFRRWA